MGRLRFALLHDGAQLERWHLRCLEELEGVAELAWVAVAPGPPPARTGSRLLDRYLRRVERGSVVEIGDRFAHFPPVPRDGTAAVDFVLGLGHVEVPRALADTARLGVWRFEHELRASRAPFFGEVYRGENVTYAVLLAFDAPPDGASTLVEGVFRTERRSYAATRELIQGTIASWPAHACRRIGTGAALPAPREIVQPGSERGSLGGLAARIATRRLALAWARLFRHPQWNVGVLDRPIETLLAPGAYTGEDVHWFPLRGRRTFLADPFAVERDGRLHVLCESFEYGSALGRISALELSGDGFAAAPRRAFAPPTHVSYPFLLDLPEGLHCIPETADVDEVALYRVGESPAEWEKVALLLEGFSGVDPTVFRHDGRWWLMCTRKGPLEDTELLVWHAPAVGGPWEPHALNPVKTDVRRARPAGPPFVHQGVLYRPAQDCSGVYGGRITLHRVKELTPTAFEEEQVTLLEASPRCRYPVGPHTLTPIGDRVLVDGRRTVFVPAAFRAFLRIWVDDVRGRLSAARTARR